MLVAPDSFKGTFSAREVAGAIAAGLERAGLEALACPVADGGEGTIDVLAEALPGSLHEVAVEGPLGAPVPAARFAVLDLGERRVGVVEAAEAAGLGLVEPAARDPEAATTRGVGELVVAALETGVRRVLVTVGGTATTDGGAGAVEVIEGAGGLGDRELVVLCDVATPFEQAASVFAPQKGADADAVARLEQRLGELAASFPRDPRGIAGGGAGGGLAGGLWAALGAGLVPGAETVLDLIGFEAKLRSAGSVIVGEGRLDGQTEAGKVIAEICGRARRAQRRVDAIVGSDALPASARERLGLASVREAGTIAALEAAAAELGEALLAARPRL